MPEFQMLDLAAAYGAAEDIKRSQALTQNMTARTQLEREQMAAQQREAQELQHFQERYAELQAFGNDPAWRKKIADQIRAGAPQYANASDDELVAYAAAGLKQKLGIKDEKVESPTKPTIEQQDGYSYLWGDKGVVPGSVQQPQRAPLPRPSSGGAAGSAPTKPTSTKPLPTGALRIVDEAKQAIAAASDSKAIVDSAVTMLRGGKVKLGAVRNVESRTRNFAGMSDENSRAYASLRQTLEKLRNNYLLLAKGVQTEGDAVRAWNSEIGESVQNDNALALQQLEKAQGMIDRALEAQNSRIETVYGNFGQEPPTAAAGAAGAAPVSGQTIIRNPKTGERRVWVETENGGVWQPIKP